MDLTSWLEYYVTGLATQLDEVKERGRQAIQSDALACEYHLNTRQTLAIRHLLKMGELSIQMYEELVPSSTRRTLQRDLRALQDAGLISADGATNQQVYRLKEI